MFSPGETIRHIFNLPFGCANVTKVIVSYYQNDRITCIKEVLNNEMRNTETGSQFTVDLSERESLLFDDDAYYYVQLNVLFNDGARATSKEMRGRNIRQHIREVVNSNG